MIIKSTLILTLNGKEIIDSCIHNNIFRYISDMGFVINVICISALHPLSLSQYKYYFYLLKVHKRHLWKKTNKKSN